MAVPVTIQKHSPNYCTCCGEDLSAYPVHFIGRRQVINIPPIEPIVTEQITFLDNPNIPPDNNASERAIRNFKVKLKVSNFFRSSAGSDCYAAIRSIIDTASKNHQNQYVVTRLIARLLYPTE